MESKVNKNLNFRLFALLVILLGFSLGLVLIFIDKDESSILTYIGSGLISTAFISLFLDIFWSKERIAIEKEELSPFIDDMKDFASRLTKIEGRLEAFKQLGFNYCYKSRREALENFIVYVKEIVDSNDDKNTVNIVSSSARGLLGYFDRDAKEIQKQWRDLITKSPKSFKILLTHPSYAYLRQPAEERSPGDIEMEILKTAIFLYSVGMNAENLRFYRGSPTVFTIQVKNHILINPYPYGKMAMDTLCLEFESQNENSLIADFTRMHFNHTWQFLEQKSKVVDEKPLVVGVDSFDDILNAFIECRINNKIRLSRHQVEELDNFIEFLSKKIEKQEKSEHNMDDMANNLKTLAMKKPFSTRLKACGIEYF